MTDKCPQCGFPFDDVPLHPCETHTKTASLERIAEIIEAVDNRCLHIDGPVPPTLDEMTQDEISAIYALAKGKPEDWRP